MNAFAAQVVLAELKPPEMNGMSSSDSQRTVFGLPRFVWMSSLERIKMFERLLGGRKVLHQVSAVLDANWTLFQP